MNFIYLQNPGSEGGRALAESAGLRRIRHERSTFRGSPRKIVVNWGSSRLPDSIGDSRVINTARAVGNAANKLSFFRSVPSDITVPWTADFSTATSWLEEGETVVARTSLNGHSGEGIVLMNSSDPDSIVQAPLYTKYVKKIDEYRIHVMNGQVISMQRKALSQELLAGRQANFMIRNHANGFVFARENVNPPQDVIDKSIRAVSALGLDFGAVDVIYNSRHGRGYVLEVNTAPGLVGTTLTDYSTAITNLINSLG